MKNWSFKRLFTARDNLIALVTILVAFMVAILAIFTSYIETPVLLASILLVLGLIASTGIIEREARVAEISTNLETIQSEVAKINKPFMLRLKDIPLLEEYMSGSDELFYTGGHLNALIMSNHALFEKWLKSGRSLKFILQNPKNEGLYHLEMPCIEYKAKSYV